MVIFRTGDYELITTTPPSFTNADRIRSMTDEELDNWIAINTDCYYCKVSKDGRCDSLTATPCDSVWLDWLRQETDDEN